MKLRLQESFKELIEMNSVVATLRKEAERGNDSVEARNIMLQKNLAKLSTDFEISTRELRAANSRMRELEYELEQMVCDLNVKGETLKKATASNIQLKTLLETTENELKDLTKTHEQLILQKAKVEADGRSEKLRSEQIIVDLKRNVSKLNTNLENTTQAKTDLETHLKVANAENNSLNESLKVQTEAKNELEVSLNRLKTSSKAEILSRDSKITNLTNENAKSIVLLKAAQEKKEQLTFKVTDLENNLDIEITNARVAKEELQKLKREYELKNNTLLEQVDKLTSLKNSLTLDKKDLNDKMKNLRIGLREKEDALAEVETALSNEKEAMLALKAKFEEELSVLAKDHHQLKSEHEILNKRYELEVDENQKLLGNKTSLESELAALQIDLLEARNKFQALTKDQDDLNKELQRWKALHSELMKKHEILTGTNRESAIEYANYKRYAEDLIQDRNIEVQEMAIKLDSVNAKIIAADDHVHNLQVKLESTNQELETTQVKLNKQLTTTELLELHLDQTRKDYMYEKKMRRDIERVQMTLRYGDSTRAFDHLADWKARDRTLNQVCVGLKNESTRLVDLVELLPKEGGFGNETEFQWPAEFNLQAKKNKKK
jgi:chromosome segregation ATPase